MPPFRVLVLGDGNFSFSLAVAELLGGGAGWRRSRAGSGSSTVSSGTACGDAGDAAGLAASVGDGGGAAAAGSTSVAVSADVAADHNVGTRDHDNGEFDGSDSDGRGGGAHSGARDPADADGRSSTNINAARAPGTALARGPAAPPSPSPTWSTWPRASSRPCPARALLRVPDGVRSADVELVCTSFDSREQLLAKYPEFSQIGARLERKASCTLQHQVNAWELESTFTARSFDAIVWNHPHLGVEDFRLHRFLMAHFFRSASSALTPGGCVVVSLVRGQETRWELPAQASRPGTGLSLVDCAPFVHADFPGFVCKRNKNGQSFKNSKTKRHVGGDMPSFAFTFAHKGEEQAVGGVAMARANEGLAAKPDAPGPVAAAAEEQAVGGVAMARANEGLAAKPDAPGPAAAAAEAAGQAEREPASAASGDGGESSAEGAGAADGTGRAAAAAAGPPAAGVGHKSAADPESLIAEVIGSAEAAAAASSSGDAGAFPCKYCTRSFASLRGVKTHTRQVHELKKYGDEWEPKRAKRLRCTHCSRVYHDGEALWQHIVSKHSFDGGAAAFPASPLTAVEAEMGGDREVDFFPCGVCGQAVPAHWHMDQHLEMLKPLCGVVAECKVCSRQFIEHRALRQHLNFCRLRAEEGDGDGAEGSMKRVIANTVRAAAMQAQAAAAAAAATDAGAGAKGAGAAGAGANVAVSFAEGAAKDNGVDATPMDSGR